MRVISFRATGIAAIVVGGLLATARIASAQGNPEVGAVLTRLGIPRSSLGGVPNQDLEVVCRPGAPGSRCDVNYKTRSDETCRAIAVQVGLRQRASQMKEGGSPGVVTSVHCGSGIFAVFETGPRRAVLGHRDAAGNTAQRQIPL